MSGMDYKSLQAWIGVSVVIFITGSAGCGPRSQALGTLGQGVALSGKVLDSFGVAVAGATVSVGGQGSQTITDAQGQFKLLYPGNPNDAIALMAEGPGHARVVRPYTVVRVQTAPIVLQVRALDLDRVITLPGANDPPLKVEIPGADGGASLTVGPNAMVQPDGSLASGQARLRMTLWYPNDAMDTAPGVLYAQGEDPNLTRLQTFGMADIEISQVSQNANLLQVAPGQSLLLTVGANLDQRPNLAAGVGLPHLYSLNVKSGFWHDEGNFADGKLAYQSSTGVLTAHLPHLSSWNIDSGIPSSNGGCVQGQVRDLCDPNRAMGVASVDVWLLNWEQTAVFRVQSDAQGNYCAQTGTPTVQGNVDTSTRYLVTGKDGQTTSQCDPRPDACKECSSSSSTYCNDCRMAASRTGANSAASVYTDTCQPATPSVTLQPCTFCPGQAPQRCTMPGSNGGIRAQGCSFLEPVLIPGPDCHCNAAGKCNLCTSALGQDCDATHPCCSNGDGTPNVCLDFKCVPPNDPAPGH